MKSGRRGKREGKKDGDGDEGYLAEILCLLCGDRSVGGVEIGVPLDPGIGG